MASICIVGSGPAGTFAGVGLAEAGHEVTILETGSDEPDTDPAAFVDRIDVRGGATQGFGLSRQIGGASNLWAGRVAQLEPVDFEHRDWIPGSGWPFGFAELAGHYDRAAEIMGLPDLEGAAPGEAVPEGWGKLIADSISMKRIAWSKPAFNVGAYLRDAVARLGGKLRLITGAHVRRLTKDAGGRRIRSADAIIDGEAVRAEADIFILAAGGIESPRILLNSAAERPTAFGNAAGLLGRYLSTHPKADMGFLVLFRRARTAFPVFSDRDFRYGLGLNAARQRELRTLNHYVQLSPVFESGRLLDAIKGSGHPDSPLLNRSRPARHMLAGLGDIAREIAERTAGLEHSARTFVLRGFLDQFPHPDNRVQLSDAVDRFGCPKADICWQFSDADRLSVIAFFGELDEAFRRSGLGFVAYSALTDTEEWPINGMHSHFMGTTRIGADEQDGVVDSDCRVFGTQNLYVAGPSTFRTYGHANPFLTIAAMSLRLAGHIARTAPAGAAPSRPFAIVPKEA